MVICTRCGKVMDCSGDCKKIKGVERCLCAECEVDLMVSLVGVDKEILDNFYARNEKCYPREYLDRLILMKVISK